MYDILRPLINARFKCHPMKCEGVHITRISDDIINAGDLPLGLLAPSELAEYDLPDQPDLDAEGIKTFTTNEGDERDKVLYRVPGYATGWHKRNRHGDDWKDFNRAYIRHRILSNIAVTYLFEEATPVSEPSCGSILVVCDFKKCQYIRSDVAASKSQDPPFDESPCQLLAENPGEIAFYAMMWSDYGPFNVTCVQNYSYQSFGTVNPM